ncbi:MAG: SLBB domain-containing protein [Halanaerobium sp.]|nr:SLBB domain-containing protein [Halanaerobium sp.]
MKRRGILQIIRNTNRQLALFLAVVLLGGLAPVVAAAEQYRLHVDDVLLVSVWGHPDLQQETLVGPDGNVSFPLIGDVQAEGLTVDELKAAITHQLAKFIKDPRVNITLQEYQRVRVLVLGQVQKPGAFELPAGKRILDVISLTGGPTQIADLTDVRLTRGEEVHLINLDALFKGEDTSQNLVLQDGDVLYLPESIIEVTILGEVMHPGRYQLKKGLRVSDLLAQAGGLTEAAAKEATYTSGEEVNRLDLEAIYKGEQAANPVLAAGDTILVPQTSYEVTILGEVHKPGAYPWRPNLRLADLVAQAGNVTERGDLADIKVVVGPQGEGVEAQEKSTRVINLKRYLEDAAEGANPLLHPGDIILVGEVDQIDWQKVFFFVGGFKAIKDLLGVDW